MAARRPDGPSPPSDAGRPWLAALRLLGVILAFAVMTVLLVSLAMSSMPVLTDVTNGIDLPTPRR